jgi:hypothetical protein
VFWSWEVKLLYLHALKFKAWFREKYSLVFFAGFPLLIVGVLNTLLQFFNRDFTAASFYPLNAFGLIGNPISIVPVREIAYFQLSVNLDTVYILTYMLAFTVFGLVQSNLNPWGFLTLSSALIAGVMDFAENEGLRVLFGTPALTPLWPWLSTVVTPIQQLDLLQAMAILKFFFVARAVSSASTTLRGASLLARQTQACLTLSAWVLTVASIVNMFKPLQSQVLVAVPSLWLLSVGHVGLFIGLFLAMRQLAAMVSTGDFDPEQPLSHAELRA